LGTFADDFDLLLVSVDSLEADLAKDLLAAGGIPSLSHGPDFDRAELGVTVHNMLRGTDVYVPKGSAILARGILAEAWGEELVARLARGE
jgi:hypothetical protein